MQGRRIVPPILTAAHRLAVNGYHRSIGGGHQVLNPPEEGGLEGVRIEGGKDPTEGVVGGDHMRQGTTVSSQARLAWPKRSISTKESAPQITPHKAIVMIASRSCRLQRSMRGSGRSVKCVAMAESGCMAEPPAGCV